MITTGLASLRIGTWNTEYAAGEQKNRLRLARLRGEVADLWVLTETHDELDLSPTHEALTSAQRPTGRPGGRWTTIWTRWPVVERLHVDDPFRTVAAVLNSPVGPLVAFGTVLPWHSDTGHLRANPMKQWAEQDRVLPLQVAEWRRLRQNFPDLPLVVAGDLNMNLGGKHYYGTARGRQTLRDGLAELGLVCVTETARIPAGALRNPPIDHVLVPDAWEPTSRVVGAWEGKTDDGLRLSDHSGLVVQATLNR